MKKIKAGTMNIQNFYVSFLACNAVKRVVAF